MGIDPGTARLGWAVVASLSNKISTVVYYGCLETQSSLSLDKRLLKIFNSLTLLFKKYKPDVVAVEELFFAANAKTAITVGQARGVIIVAAAKANLPVVSYTPLVVKQTIAGTGTADKKQMQFMVTRLLKLKQTPEPDDAADALAIALTHAYSYKMKEAIT